MCNKRINNTQGIYVRIITQMRIKQAIEEYPQWRFGLQLWLEVFKQKDINFESYQQIKREVYSHAKYDKWCKTKVKP